MIYQANPATIEKFISLPETGMGYQFFNAKSISSFIPEQYCIFNCNYIIKNDVNFSINKRMLLLENKKLQLELKNEDLLNLNFSSINILKKNEVDIQKSFVKESYVKYEINNSKKRNFGKKGAIDNQINFSDGKKVFVRLSAFENDKRIDKIANRLLPNSYTTTDEDYLTCLKYEDDPIDRYALPNDDEIKWSFFIRPTCTNLLQLGVVQPANGHSGGGIEAYFKHGTTPNTLIDTRPYGK